MKLARWMIALCLAVFLSDIAGAAVVQGRVTLAADGSPAPGVDIEVYRKPKLHATTDAAGYYELKGLRQGIYSISCKPQGYLSSRVRFSISQADTFTIDMELVASADARTSSSQASLEVIVIGGSQAKAISGASIHLEGPSSRTGSSNGKGICSISGLRPGTYSVYATHPSYGRTDAKTIQVPPGGIKLDTILRFFPDSE